MIFLTRITCLDDFIILCHPGSPKCQQSVGRLLGLFDHLGIKLEGPPTTLTFLGIEINIVALEVRLPAAKLCTLQDTVHEWLGRKSCSRSDLESPLGSLVHVCCVVKEVKTFLCRLFELLLVAKREHHHLRLNAGAPTDIQVQSYVQIALGLGDSQCPRCLSWSI